MPEKNNMKKKDEKVAIVLGAGASVDCGIPSQARFVAVSKELARQAQSNHSTWYSDLVSDFQSKYLNSENIELLLVAAEMLRIFPLVDLSILRNPEDGILVTATHRPAKYLVEAIQFLIVNTLKVTLSHPHLEGFSAYKKLVRSFSGTILSFNWDTLIEMAYEAIFNCRMPFELDQQENIKYIKLHGSIDWCFDSNGNQIRIGVPLSTKTVWERKPDEHTHSSLTPILIYPNYLKSTQLNRYGELMLRLWESASKQLSTASRIIFVGYSMPESDIDARMLFHSALSRNLHKPIRIEIIDKEPNESLYKRYYLAFSDLNKDLEISLRKMTFVEWVDSQF